MSKFALLAKTMLKNLSKYETIYKSITSSNDPMFPSSTTVELPITAYIKAPTSGDIAAGLATASDIVVLVSGADITIAPKLNDTIDTYTVKKIIEVKETNNTTALYKFICEKR